jgi:hypothetical protein
MSFWSDAACANKQASGDQHNVFIAIPSAPYSAADLESAIRWIESEHFTASPELVQELRWAVER